MAGREGVWKGKRRTRESERGDDAETEGRRGDEQRGKEATMRRRRKHGVMTMRDGKPTTTQKRGSAKNEPTDAQLFLAVNEAARHLRRARRIHLTVRAVVPAM